MKTVPSQLISVIPEYSYGIETAVFRLPVNGFILHRRGEMGRHGDTARGDTTTGYPRGVQKEGKSRCNPNQT